VDPLPAEKRPQYNPTIKQDKTSYLHNDILRTSLIFSQRRCNFLVGPTFEPLFTSNDVIDKTIPNVSRGQSSKYSAFKSLKAQDDYHRGGPVDTYSQMMEDVPPTSW